MVLIVLSGAKSSAKVVISPLSDNLTECKSVLTSGQAWSFSQHIPKELKMCHSYLDF